jgi:hypothetical protein
LQAKTAAEEQERAEEAAELRRLAEEEAAREAAELETRFIESAAAPAGQMRDRSLLPNASGPVKSVAWKPIIRC